MTTRTRLRRTDGPGSGGTHDHTRGAPSEPLKGPSNATEALETPPPVPKLLEPGPRRAAPHTGIVGARGVWRPQRHGGRGGGGGGMSRAVEGANVGPVIGPRSG